MTKPINPQTMAEFAEAVIDCLTKSKVFHDVNIYVNNLLLTSNPYSMERFTEHQTTKGSVYYQHKDPKDVVKHLEYCCPDTLSMTFEGPLYHDVNRGKNLVTMKLDKIASKYGLYHELGHAWSLSFYKLP